MDLFNRITVLSLEQATVLPYLTYRLAQDGVRVVRLEHPVYGDPNRLIGERVLDEDRMNSYFLCINAGKEALTLNLADRRGRELFNKLLTELPVDIFCTNQLPRNYQKLGVDYDTIRQIRPDIIWLGVTGYGSDRNEAAYDPILQARSGLMELTGEPDGPPQVSGIPLPDMGCSEHAYGQIMKALYRRQATGEGTRIDLAMLDSTASWLTVPFTMSATFGREMTRRGATHEFFAPVSVYRTVDGYLYLAVGNDKQWANLVKLEGFTRLDKPDYRNNAGRIAEAAKLNSAIEQVTKTKTTAELLALFIEAGLAAARINTIAQATADPYIKPNLLKSIDPRSGLELTLAPPPLTTEALASRNRSLSFPPRFGEHNEIVYGRELGLDEGTLADYKKRSVI